MTALLEPTQFTLMGAVSVLSDCSDSYYHALLRSVGIPKRKA
jgi:hypothetical protein